MKIEKSEPNEYDWYSVFKFRESMPDFIIERKSTKFHANDHEIYLEWNEAIQFAKFVKKYTKMIKAKKKYVINVSKLRNDKNSSRGR